LFRFSLSALLLGFGLLAPAAFAQNASPTGLWMTANHNAVVQIAPCGADLCGRIVGTVLGPNDPTPTDWTGAPQCGLTIFRTAPQRNDDGTTEWDGTILDPRDGSHYGARITLSSSTQLQLRGYLGLPIFGQTQTWTPYNRPVAANCRIQPSEIARNGAIGTGAS
jgi:uncharacterized protein (DUF2147 family)